MDVTQAEMFRTRWNLFDALEIRALDRRHIAVKKPKKSGSEYYNYKSYCSLALLELVDADHRFLQIDVIM